MSKILKKITKKYKWLRFLNYKTTKLAVLSAALFGLCLSSGASFAKYRDENYGGGNAGAAQFNFGKITFTNKSIKQPTLKDNIKAGVHAFVCEFQLEIPETEVSFTYDVKLRLTATDVNDFDAEDVKLDHTKFVSDIDGNDVLFYVFAEDNNGVVKTNQKTIAEVTETNNTDKPMSYSKGYWYYAVGEETNGSIKYTWDKSNEFDKDDEDNLTDIISFDSGSVKAGESLIKYFKIVIFVDAEIKGVGNNQLSWDAENSKILYSLHAIQEG